LPGAVTIDYAHGVRSTELNRSGGRPVSVASLDRASFVPLYFQLAEILKERIDAGMWEPGDRFLSENEIEAEFGVSRTVIRPALALLESDGQLVRSKGRGNFVAPPKVGVRVTGLGRLLCGVDVNGMEVHILEARSLVPERAVAEKLHLDSVRDKVAHVTARICVSGLPVMLCNSFVALEQLPGFLQVARASRRGEPVAPELDTSFSHAEVNLETAFVSLWEAEELQLSPGDPCFLMSYVDFVRSPARPASTRPAEFARLVAKADVRLDLAV
jgi:GntR family transcriptional regulator